MQKKEPARYAGGRRSQRGEDAWTFPPKLMTFIQALKEPDTVHITKPSVVMEQ
jgi:hypothetical protein